MTDTDIRSLKTRDKETELQTKIVKLEKEIEVLKARIAKAEAACEAAIRYDESIAGAVARGKVSITNKGVQYVMDHEDLYGLYCDWINKAQEALIKARPVSNSNDETKETSTDTKELDAICKKR